MGSGGVAIAALPTVICLKVPFSDGLGGVFLYTKELTPLVAFVGTFIVCYVSRVIIAGCKYTKFLC